MIEKLFYSQSHGLKCNAFNPCQIRLYEKDVKYIVTIIANILGEGW